MSPYLAGWRLGLLRTLRSPGDLSVRIGFFVSIPIAMAVLIGMMWVAMGDSQPWYVWVGFGAGMGFYAAGFLGTTAGVLLSARRLNRIAGGSFL